MENPATYVKEVVSFAQVITVPTTELRHHTQRLSVPASAPHFCPAVPNLSARR